MPIRQTLIKCYQILVGTFGFDPRSLIRSLRGLPIYIKDWREFRKGYSGSMNWMPCLHDRYEEGGATKGEYFWQDLLVARLIFAANPKRHVDIGSRVDGFVAHVASFREIEIFDVRPISTPIPGVVFKQADLMSSDSMPNEGEGYCDSLSCLHALEHFGLGRYGDPIDPVGHELGIANMASLLEPGGTFYLSTPIGQERVEFNAHRVFDPRRIIQLAESHALTLHQFIVVDGGARDVPLTQESLQSLSEASYNLGIFVFTKS